eukprot:TRINITY_DN6094_c0_g2_i1.p1 TRINITY_DN6094_c0_g2~~TRINITY_DN6094_c0_g2_i1.p1  ORF type:complete len:491 (-),score=120.78 TRINITY_DN6094_c0_g2_i1:172-1644(-)
MASSASMRARVLSAHRAVCSYVTELVALDLRSLALYRVLMAVSVLADMWYRSYYLSAHYTDDGLWSRQNAVDHGSMNEISLYTACGGWYSVSFLFLVNIFAACCLLIGYHSRLAVVWIWFNTVCLQNRNTVILNGGDVVMRMLLFWSMCLPLAEVCSVDKALNDIATTNHDALFASEHGDDGDSSGKDRDSHHVKHAQADQGGVVGGHSLLHRTASTTAATSTTPMGGNTVEDRDEHAHSPLGLSSDAHEARVHSSSPSGVITSYVESSVAAAILLFQFGLIYICTHELKTGLTWKDGSAVYYALNNEQFTTSLGMWLLFHLPISGIRFLTWGTGVWQQWGPLLLVFPIQPLLGAVRTLGCFGFIAMHVGFGSTMHLGLFMYMPMVGAVALLPAFFWERLVYPTVDRVSASLFLDHEGGQCIVPHLHLRCRRGLADPFTVALRVLHSVGLGKPHLLTVVDTSASSLSSSPSSSSSSSSPFSALSSYSTSF